MLKIGNISIPSSLMLAPMAGISDLPFRMLNRSFGCEFAFTEMISAGSLVCDSGNTRRMLSSTPKDRPLGVQILGSKPDRIERAIELLSAYEFDILDFNAACPVPKVISKGEGSGLLRELSKLQALLKIIVKHAGRPVTVKIRSGWDETSVNAEETAMRAQDAGVSAVFIHGRTRMQGYRGTVDYGIIRRVKRALKIPVIASGDALSPVLIKRLFDETGCDGVTVARGALGNPWIFLHTKDYLQGINNSVRPEKTEIMKTMTDHLDSLTEFYGERDSVKLFRKFFGWYTKGLAAKDLKRSAFQAETRLQMLQLIEKLENVRDEFQETHLTLSVDF